MLKRKPKLQETQIKKEGRTVSIHYYPPSLKKVFKKIEKKAEEKEKMKQFAEGTLKPRKL